MVDDCNLKCKPLTQARCDGSRNSQHAHVDVPNGSFLNSSHFSSSLFFLFRYPLPWQVNPHGCLAWSRHLKILISQNLASHYVNAIGCAGKSGLGQLCHSSKAKARLYVYFFESRPIIKKTALTDVLLQWWSCNAQNICGIGWERLSAWFDT